MTEANLSNAMLDAQMDERNKIHQSYANEMWSYAAGGLRTLIAEDDSPIFDTIEADSIYNDKDVFEVLCEREDGGDDPASKDHAMIANTISGHRNADHSVWDTLDSFIRTVCEYDHAYLFENADVLDNLHVLITGDYLDRVLLAPKPEPAEIDEDAWNKMASRLIDKTDEMNRQARKSGNDVVIFSEVMSQALSGFFNENAEELVFFETVGDLLNTFSEHENYTHYHSGMLDVRSFDLLREYGIPFAKPLFERSIDDMRNAPFRTDWRTIEHD